VIYIKSDLIDELLAMSKYSGILGDITEKGNFGYTKYELEVDEKISKEIGKNVGHYVTINCSRIFSYLKNVQNYVSNKLAKSIGEFISKINNPLILVVGLGNGGMVADSLGVECSKKLLITEGVPDDIKNGLGRLCYLEPKVKGVTGINSFDVVKGVVDRIKPDFVFAIDTLCSNDISRLMCSFQLSNAGVAPGAGVNNRTQVLNSKSLGTNVLAIGVPLIISGENLEVKNKEYNDLHFTIKEIDFYIKACSNIISRAINIAVHGDVYKKYDF